MSCDVDQYITDPDDASIQEAETIVHLPMVCLPNTQRRRRGFLPQMTMTYRVESSQGHILSLHAYTQWSGLYVDLQSSDMMVRKLHTHESHYNPDGMEVPGPHIHFPSLKYPLIRSKSEWAYPIELADPDDLHECVQALCFELDIDIESLQFQFDPRRS